MSTFIAPYETASTNESAMQGTPFPHDAASILFRSEANLNTDHLPAPEPDLANNPTHRKRSDPHTNAVYGMPSDGQFSFQKANTKKRFDERVRVARQVAARRGVTNIGYTGCKFYGAHARLNLRLQSRSITAHKYYEYDIVNNVNMGNNVVAKGTIEFLNAIYQDVPAAVADYWSRRNAKKIKPSVILRYFITSSFTVVPVPFDNSSTASSSKKTSQRLPTYPMTWRT